MSPKARQLHCGRLVGGAAPAGILKIVTCLSCDYVYTTTRFNGVCWRTERDNRLLAERLRPNRLADHAGAHARRRVPRASTKPFLRGFSNQESTRRTT
jgi:hypothetical protein